MFSLNSCFTDLSDSQDPLKSSNPTKVLLHLGKTSLCQRIIANCKFDGPGTNFLNKSSSLHYLFFVLQSN